MSDKINSSRRHILISVFMMFSIVLLAGGIGIYVLSDPGLQEALKLSRIAEEVDNQYPGQLDWDEMFDKGMRSMFSKLDRYSSYVPQERFEQIDEEMTGGYGGIGVTISPHEKGLLIISVREGGPAAKGALLNGDIILKADSVLLSEVTPADASDLLRGEEGTELELTVLRPVSLDTLKVKLTRSRIDFLHIPFAGFTPDSMIYVRILDFDMGMSDDLKDAFDSLLKKDIVPQGVILDLRGNPGGLFSEAYETANLFLDEGQFIVGTDARSIWNEEEHYSTGEDITGDLPLTILVDNGSASAAEIVAGSLQQLDRAILVGDTTFGKGLVQGFTRFPDGSGVRLTISRYFLPGAVYLNEFDSTLDDIGHGIVPDYIFPFNDRKEFPRMIENSQLLQKFAAENEEEIISATDQFALSDEWVNRFAVFASNNGFKFESRATRSLDLMMGFARLEKVNMRTYKPLQRLQRKARSLDKQKIIKFGDYIKFRLKQIAYERKFGIYQSYANAIVPERDDILYAANLMKQKLDD